MNKSILLVMCDMLVLSVMSLSDGGFAQEESDSKTEVVEVVAQKDYADLARRLEEAEKKAAAAKNGEDDAWDEVIRAQDEAKQAKVDAESARTAAMEAEEREKATKAEADEAKAELAKIRARQAALVGNIPQQLSWEVFVFCKDRKKRHVHSPLVEIGNRQFVFFELNHLKIKTLDDIVWTDVRQGDTSFKGTACMVERFPGMAFVEIKPGEKLKSIGFGLSGIPRLDDNIVYRPHDGSCEGNPVPCESDSGNTNNLYCSVKTENRTVPQQVRGDHSVQEGCLLLSMSHGCVAAIVGEKDGVFAGRRKCEVLRPIKPEELIPLL